MAPNKQAQKTHQELFPGHVSRLAVSDPELIETFDNFAFDEVLRDTKLDPRTRLMIQLAAVIACQALGEYRVMLGAALTVGVTPIEAKEIVYQAVPYVGMAKVFDFLHATNEVLNEHGAKLPLPGQSTTTAENRTEKGLAVQKQIIGDDTVAKLYASSPRISCTFSIFFRRTALATITRATASMWRRASSSPSACSSRWAAANRRSKDMSRRPAGRQ